MWSLLSSNVVVLRLAIRTRWRIFVDFVDSMEGKGVLECRAEKRMVLVITLRHSIKYPAPTAGKEAGAAKVATTEITAELRW